jgi:hypothetical protein
MSSGDSALAEFERFRLETDAAGRHKNGGGFGRRRAATVIVSSPLGCRPTVDVYPGIVRVRTRR